MKVKGGGNGEGDRGGLRERSVEAIRAVGFERRRAGEGGNKEV